MPHQQMFRLLIILSALVLNPALSSSHGSQKKMNVLFIMADDMRPDIGAYREKNTNPVMHTPNLDALAARSLLLRHTYAQQAMCSPSRTSMLTGRRPDTTRVYDLLHYWRTEAGNFTTLPQFLKENGYRTAGCGKIYHPGEASGQNDPLSWTERYFDSDGKYWTKKYGKEPWHAASESEVLDHPLPDMETLDHAVTMLTNLSSTEQPFFLAVGFKKPHLPFLFPEKFLDFHPLSDITLPLNHYAPVDMPEVAWNNFFELRRYVGTRYGYGSINTTLPDDVTKGLRRGYYASISYVDSLVGLLMDRLYELGLKDNTIVSFVGDHGYHLGEHGLWCKCTNFELATRVPAMIAIPKLTDRGSSTSALVEMVDIFPTIVDALGFPEIHQCPEISRNIALCTEGKSFLPLFHDDTIQLKSAAFSQYPRMSGNANAIMGYTMRTDRYRYTEWMLFEIGKFRPLEKKLVPAYFPPPLELYDHLHDPDENVNVANWASYAEIRAKLSKALKRGWRHALLPSAPPPYTRSFLN